MEMIAPQAAAVPQAKASALLRRASLALVATVWASGILFGAYILLFFGGSALGGLTARWNDALQGLHDPALPSAVIAIGFHFVPGGMASRAAGQEGRAAATLPRRHHRHTAQDRKSLV